jgi:hypothetical protein
VVAAETDSRPDFVPHPCPTGIGFLRGFLRFLRQIDLTTDQLREFDVRERGEPNSDPTVCSVVRFSVASTSARANRKITPPHFRDPLEGKSHSDGAVILTA